MNRSVERRRFAIAGTEPGRLLAGAFVHPRRGRVRCPAASLVVAGLRRAGHQVDEHAGFLRPQDNGHGVLFTASFLDRAGGPVGLAVAAHETDLAGMAAASEAVASWSALWRSRRVVIADMRQECAIPLPGIRRGDAESPAFSSEYDAWIEPEVHKACSHVLQAHAVIRSSAEQGELVLVIGRHGHASTRALLALAPDRVVLVETVDDVPDLRLPPESARFVVQPGIPIEQAMIVVAAIRARYPALRGASPDGFCYAASDRAATLRVIAGSCDRVFLIGEAATADDLPALQGARVHALSDPARLSPAWLAGTECVGLVPGGQASGDLLRHWIDVLSGLGPISVVRRRTVSEVVQPHGRGLTEKNLVGAQAGVAGREAEAVAPPS